MNFAQNKMNLKENQIIAQYAMLRDKVIEIENEIKTKKAKVDQEINRIEAYNNISSQDEQDILLNSSTTEKNSESIIRISPILEPAFFNTNYYQPLLPIQICNNLVNKLNQLEVEFVATQPMKNNISFLDIHTLPNLLCIGSDGLLRIYNLLDGSVFFNWDISLDSYENNITCMAKIPNRDYIAVGFEDGFVRILNLSSTVIAEFLVSNEELSSIFYSSKQILFCYSKNKEITCWKGENNCLQANIFDGPILSFKDIDDPSTNDVYILSENSKIYRWDIENNTFITYEQDHESDNNNKMFIISADENKVIITPSYNEKDSSNLIIDIPNYSLFDKNDSYFCLSTEARFFVYKVTLNNKIDNASILDETENKSKNEESNDSNNGNQKINETNDNSSNLNIDTYLLGNVNQNKIQNMHLEDEVPR